MVNTILAPNSTILSPLTVDLVFSPALAINGVPTVVLVSPTTILVANLVFSVMNNTVEAQLAAGLAHGGPLHHRLLIWWPSHL